MTQSRRLTASKLYALLGLSIVAVGLIVFGIASNSSSKFTSDPLEISAKDDGYLGSESCAGCHSQAYQDWRGSHHDQSMQHATAATVKGNFDNVFFSAPGNFSAAGNFSAPGNFSAAVNSAWFFKKGDDFYARLAGNDGKLEEHKILYTFGTVPLQQYLVAFPNGRLQQLPVAWNTLTEQWFDPQPELQAKPGEWVFWTHGGKNWNSMCADCHSSNVAKNFDLDSNSYSTTVSVLDVGCESCHGPGRDHVKTVSAATFSSSTSSQLHLDMSVGENPQALVDKCGRCHARRQQLTAQFEHGSDLLLDHYLPALISPPSYHSDGQILDEVFVYGSFLQSKMYQSGVSCLNCHQPHSMQLKAEGNQLCTGCHNSEQFDTPLHHHHAGVGIGSGSQCIDCHMPGRTYMGNDFRRDHSFRVPRPDLSVAHATPNACNDCHADQSSEWAAARVEDWFGPQRPAHFSETLTQAVNQPQQSLEPLMALLQDITQPAIARATAASLLAPAISLPSVESAISNASQDSNALVRAISAQSLATSPNKLSPLLARLDDPVRAVRIAAAQALSDLPQDQIPADSSAAFNVANREYQASLAVNADFPSGRLQMALDQHRRGNLAKATRLYLETLKIDSGFNAARMNLAQLYYSQGKLDETEQLYRTVIAQEPQASDAHYSLGLLMAEKGDYQQAAKALKDAAITGNNPRAWYNLAVLYQQQGQALDSEKAYLKALDLSPNDVQFINGLVSLYGQQQRWFKAMQLLDRALLGDPANSNLLQLKRAVEQRLGN